MPNVKHSLIKPIVFGEQTITELDFREPCAGDWRGVKISGDGLDVDAILLVAGRVTNNPPAVMAKLSQADMFEVAGIIGNFSNIGLKTGPM